MKSLCMIYCKDYSLDIICSKVQEVISQELIILLLCKNLTINKTFMIVIAPMLPTSIIKLQAF